LSGLWGAREGKPSANNDTLVITAADFVHSSFGSQDTVKWTYFGDFFFNTALRLPLI
jgi:hypothetical protein